MKSMIHHSEMDVKSGKASISYRSGGNGNRGWWWGRPKGERGGG